MKPETKRVIDLAQLNQAGFLTTEDVKAIANDPETRLSYMLTKIAEFSTYVRDISLPINFVVAGDAPKPKQWPENATQLRQDQRRRRLSGDPMKPAVSFDERDCSGVFDGNTVTSDADGGL